MFMDKFASWLRKELKDRDWSQADLAKKSGIPPASISRIINDMRGAAPETCRSLAKALNYPQEYVFRKAGLITEGEDENRNLDPTLAEANKLMSELPKEYQKQALQLVRFLHGNHVGFDPKNSESTPN